MSISEKDLLKKVSVKAGSADVYSVQHTSLSVSFKSNQLDSVESSSSEGISLRVAHRGKIGFASSIGDVSGGSDAMIKTAFETAKYGATAYFKPPARSASKIVIDNDDPKLHEPDVTLMKDLGRSLMDELRAFDKALSVDVSVSAAFGSSNILNTRGANITDRGTSFSISASINKIRGTEMIDIWEYQNSTHLFKDNSQVRDRLIQKLEWAKKSVKVNTKKMPVIFTPKGFSDVAMISILPGINGRNVAQKTSPLTDKLGTSILAKNFSMSEEPHLARQTRSSEFDNEGVRTKPKYLFEKGVLRSFVYDLQTAGEAKAKSTGNGFRGVSSLPSISFTNLKIKNGTKSILEMISYLEEGVIIDQVMGAWAGNVLGGFVSGQIHLGYYVKNGKIAGRVKDAMVSLNIYEALKGKLVMSKDQEWTYGGGNLLCPFILVPDVTISSNA